MPVLRHNAGSLAAATVLLLACTLCARGQGRGTGEAQRLFLPGMNSALDLDLRGFYAPLWERFDDEPSPATNAKAGGAAPRGMREFTSMLLPVKGKLSRVGFLLIRMEPALRAGGSEVMLASALADYPKAKNIKEGSVKPSEYGQTPLLRYSLKGFPPQQGTFLSYTGSGYSAFPVPFSIPGMPGSLDALEAFYVRDGAWVTFRLVMEKIGGEEEKVFYSLLDSVKFLDATTPSSSYDHFTLGSEFYKRKRPAEAVAALERSLALEQGRRALAQPQWRQLVMTLANALGAADDPGRAREVLEYGVAGEPTYPYFHHGLSRLHSYFGDLDRALASLEKAYEHAPEGKSFRSLIGAIPDPLLDPAFRRYKDDPRFRDAVKALKKKYKP